MNFAPSRSKVESSSNVAREEDVARALSVDVGDEPVDDERPMRTGHASCRRGYRERQETFRDFRRCRRLVDRIEPGDKIVVRSEVSLHGWGVVLPRSQKLARPLSKFRQRRPDVRRCRLP